MTNPDEKDMDRLDSLECKYLIHGVVNDAELKTRYLMGLVRFKCVRTARGLRSLGLFDGASLVQPYNKKDSIETIRCLEQVVEKGTYGHTGCKCPKHNYDSNTSESDNNMITE